LGDLVEMMRRALDFLVRRYLRYRLRVQDAAIDERALANVLMLELWYEEREFFGVAAVNGAGRITAVRWRTKPR
jgi:hypothetical protein